MIGTSPMYISPITIMQGEMNVRVENEIIKAVRNIGIDVDKEELIKALAYDRKQYEKGYEDGKAEMQWIPCSERLPERFKVVVASIRAETGYIKKPYLWDVCKAYVCGDGSWETSLTGTRDLVVEAWMPLPEPYKEETDGRAD